jgi:hypothetical protein
MVYIQDPGEGQVAGVAILEITSVPHYSLIDSNLEHALDTVQNMFTSILGGFSRQMQDSVSVEWLWKSVPVENQIYSAQVMLYAVFRMIGSDAGMVRASLEAMATGFQNEISALSYTVNGFKTDEEYRIFLNSIPEKFECISAIAKKEWYTTSAFGYIYYGQISEPAKRINVAPIANTLSNYPDCLISLQLIPTRITRQETMAVKQVKSVISAISTQMKMMNGTRVDPEMKRIVDYYEMEAATLGEPHFYYNFLVYSNHRSQSFLGTKILDCLEMDEKNDGKSFELYDVTSFLQSPATSFIVNPWMVSNILIYQARETDFWKNSKAPIDLIRLKYLTTVHEIKSLMQFPFDDDSAIGLQSRRTRLNREKLSSKVISKEGFSIGYIRGVNERVGATSAEATIPLDDFTKHALVVGMPGTGKTNFSLGLLLKFWREFHIPFIAIEPTKAEYRALIDAIPELQIFSPGKTDTSPYIINPFLPPENVTVETYSPAIMTAFKAAFEMPSPLPNVFQKAINESYTRYGWKKSSTSADPDARPFGMYEFIRVFKEEAAGLGYQGESKANIESAGVLRLVSLIEQNSNIYDSIQTIPLSDMMSKPTVIELNAIADKDQKTLIMAFLLIMLCVYAKNNMVSDGHLKNILLIDEAHVLLGKSETLTGSDSKAVTIETVEDMIAEVRALGLGIVIADQSPVAVGKNIVANTNVKVMFRLVEKENRDLIANTTNMSDVDYNEFPRLGVGEAMLHYGRLNSPLQINTYNVEKVAKIRQVITDNELRPLIHYWNDPIHKKYLIPYRECQYSYCCCDNCDLAVRDDAEYISSRLLAENKMCLQDEKTFLHFLVSMNPFIRDIIKARPSIRPNVRLYNCVKIKFFRKSLLDVSFKLNEKTIDAILKHKNFLTHGAGMEVQNDGR